MLYTTSANIARIIRTNNPEISESEKYWDLIANTATNANIKMGNAFKYNPFRERV